MTETGAERYWEGRWRDLDAELSGVHAGTHVIVPVEPTEAMLTAACLCDNSRDIYHAMISARDQ